MVMKQQWKDSLWWERTGYPYGSSYVSSYFSRFGLSEYNFPPTIDINIWWTCTVEVCCHFPVGSSSELPCNPGHIALVVSRSVGSKVPWGSLVSGQQHIMIRVRLRLKRCPTTNLVFQSDDPVGKIHSANSYCHPLKAWKRAFLAMEGWWWLPDSPHGIYMIFFYLLFSSLGQL